MTKGMAWRSFIEPKMQFGRLRTVAIVGEVTTGGGRRETLWRCECVCGNEVTVRQRYLREGRSKSCGCLRKENFKNMKRVGLGKIVDVHTKPPPSNVQARFYNPADRRAGR